MSEKKMVRRGVAIALGIVCVILLVGLVVALAYYMPIINDKDNTISSLKEQNASYVSLINELYANISQLNGNITNLKNIANLNESVVLLNNVTLGEPSTEEWGNSFKNSGYVLVKVFATADTTVEVTYSFQTLNYDSQVDVGRNGTAIFPILPSSLVIMKIGNSTAITDLVGIYANVTAIYYY